MQTAYQCDTDTTKLQHITVLYLDSRATSYVCTELDNLSIRSPGSSNTDPYNGMTIGLVYITNFLFI